MNAIKKIFQTGGFLNKNLMLYNADYDIDPNIKLDDDIQQYKDIYNSNEFKVSKANIQIPDDKLDELKDKINNILIRIVPLYKPLSLLQSINSIHNFNLYILKDNLYYSLQDNITDTLNYSINNKFNIMKIPAVYAPLIISKNIIPLNDINIPHILYIHISMKFNKEILHSFTNLYEIKENKIIIKDIFNLFKSVIPSINLINYLFHFRIENNSIVCSPSLLFNQNILIIFILSGNIDLIYKLFDSKINNLENIQNPMSQIEYEIKGEDIDSGKFIQNIKLFLINHVEKMKLSDEPVSKLEIEDILKNIKIHVISPEIYEIYENIRIMKMQKSKNKNSLTFNNFNEMVSQYQVEIDKLKQDLEKVRSISSDIKDKNEQKLLYVLNQMDYTKFAYYKSITAKILEYEEKIKTISDEDKQQYIDKIANLKTMDMDQYYESIKYENEDKYMDKINKLLNSILSINNILENNYINLIYYYNFYNIVQTCNNLSKRSNTQKSDIFNDITRINENIKANKITTYINLLFDINTLVYITSDSFTNNPKCNLHILDTCIASILNIYKSDPNFNINITTHKYSYYRKRGMDPYTYLDNYLYKDTSFYIMPQARMTPPLSISYPTLDCGEATLFNLINYLLYNEDMQKLDISRFPDSTLPELKELYTKYNSVSDVDTHRNLFYSVLHKLEFKKIVSENIWKTRIYIDNYINGNTMNVTFDRISQPTFTGFNISPSYYAFVRVFNKLIGVDKDFYENIDNFNNISLTTLKDLIATFKKPINIYKCKLNDSIILDISTINEFDMIYITINTFTFFLYSRHADIPSSLNNFPSKSLININNITRYIPDSNRNIFLSNTFDFSRLDRFILFSTLINYTELCNSENYSLFYFLISRINNYDYNTFISGNYPTYTRDEFDKSYDYILDIYFKALNEYGIDQIMYPHRLNIDLKLYIYNKYIKKFIDKFKNIKVNYIYNISAYPPILNMSKYIIIFKDNLDKLVQYTDSQNWEVHIYGLSELVHTLFLYKDTPETNFIQFFNYYYNTTFTEETLLQFYKIIIDHIKKRNLKIVYYYDNLGYFENDGKHVMINFKSTDINDINNNLNLKNHYYSNKYIKQIIFDNSFPICINFKNFTSKDIIYYREYLHLIYNEGPTFKASYLISDSINIYENKGKAIYFDRMYGDQMKQLFFYIIKYAPIQKLDNKDEQFVKSFNNYFKSEFTQEQLLLFYNTIKSYYKPLLALECFEIIKKPTLVQSIEKNPDVTKIKQIYYYSINTNINESEIAPKFLKIYKDLLNEVNITYKKRFSMYYESTKTHYYKKIELQINSR